MSIRHDKVVALSRMMDFEHESLYMTCFEYEQELYKKSCLMKVVNKRIRNCECCKGLNIKAFTESVIGFGTLNARIFFIGISPGIPCMATQIPFSGGSGYMLDAALRLSGLTRENIFISNIIHCHPDKNRQPTPEEIRHCIHFLIQELQIIKPALVVTLGTTPRDIVVKYDVMKGLDCKLHSVKHPASFLHSSLIGSKDWVIKLSILMDKFKGVPVANDK